MNYVLFLCENILINLYIAYFFAWRGVPGDIKYIMSGGVLKEAKYSLSLGCNKCTLGESWDILEFVPVKVQVKSAL